MCMWMRARGLRRGESTVIFVPLPSFILSCPSYSCALTLSSFTSVCCTWLHFGDNLTAFLLSGLRVTGSGQNPEQATTPRCLLFSRSCSMFFQTLAALSTFVKNNNKKSRTLKDRPRCPADWDNCSNRHCTDSLAKLVVNQALCM